MTGGDEYIESIKDGREIYLHGERVKNYTEHPPAFRNSIRMTARLYDAMHTGEHVDTLTTPTDTGNGGVTMPFFRTPPSPRTTCAPTATPSPPGHA